MNLKKKIKRKIENRKYRKLQEIEKTKQPRHYFYTGGFCGNCARSNPTIKIYDWYPSNGDFCPQIKICKTCLKQMLEEFK